MKKFLFIISLFYCVSAVFAQDEDISVSQDTVRLDEVVVTGTRKPTAREMIPIPLSIVRRAAIERSGETALLPVLSQQIPGLFVTSRGITGYGVSAGAAGEISLRGFAGSSGRVLILIDGHPQYATIYGHPIADSYIASDVERVEVSRGAASVLYGSNAMGGAINIITRKSLSDGNRLHARLMGGSYGTQKYMLNDSYRNGRFTSFVGGNYECTDGHRPNSAFSSLSGMGKLGYELSDEWKISANVNLSKLNSENPGTSDKPMIDGYAHVIRGMSGLSVENNFENTSGAVNLFYNWGNHIINDGYTAGGKPQPYLFRSTDYMSGVNIFQSVNIFSGNTVTAGFDAQLYGGNAYRNPETEIYADHKRLHEIAGYLFVQQQVWRFMFNVGLRLENHKLYGSVWIPQAGFSFKAAENTHLKFSVSKGFRTPNMRELYMYAVANEDLKPENSWSYDFSVSQHLLENKLFTELNLFYTKGDNIVEVVQVDGRRQNRNVGDFANKGAEISLKYNIFDNLSLNSNYSYLYMIKPITGAPRHKFYAGLNYTPGKFIFNAGVQVINRLYLQTGDNDITENYTLLDARIGYRAAKWAEIFVKGDNLLWQDYETMLGFPMPHATVMAGITLDL